MATFVITKRADGEYQFNLKSSNNKVILTSEGYKTKSGCLAGIASVRENSNLDDRFDENISSDDQFYFVLKAANGEVIGVSETYKSKIGRAFGILRVKNYGPTASIVDKSDGKVVLLRR